MTIMNTLPKGRSRILMGCIIAHHELVLIEVSVLQSIHGGHLRLRCLPNHQKIKRDSSPPAKMSSSKSCQLSFSVQQRRSLSLSAAVGWKIFIKTLFRIILTIANRRAGVGWGVERRKITANIICNLAPNPQHFAKYLSRVSYFRLTQF